MWREHDMWFRLSPLWTVDLYLGTCWRRDKRMVVGGGEGEGLGRWCTLPLCGSGITDTLKDN